MAAQRGGSGHFRGHVLDALAAHHSTARSYPVLGGGGCPDPRPWTEVPSTCASPAPASRSAFPNSQPAVVASPLSDQGPSTA